MITSDDEIDIGLLQAGSPQFDQFCAKLKRNIKHWIKQIDVGLVLIHRSKKKSFIIYYNKFKLDMLSCLSKCDRAWNFNSLCTYEYDAIKIKNDFHNQHSAFLYELRLSQHKKKLEQKKYPSAKRTKIHQDIDSKPMNAEKVCFS